MENKTLTKTQEFFKYLKEYTPKQGGKEWKWFTEGRKSKEGVINQEHLYRFKDVNGLNLHTLADVLDVHFSTLGRSVNSSIILRLCDAYNIPLKDFINSEGNIERKEPAKKWKRLENHEYTLTSSLSFTQEQVEEIFKDFYTYQEYSVRSFCSLLDLNYTGIVRGTINQNVFDSLVIYYDLRGANFKKFLGYLEEKKWFPYLEEIKRQPFIKNLLTLDIDTIEEKVSSHLFRLVEELSVDLNTKPVDFVVYAEPEELTTKNAFLFEIDSNKYRPYFKKNDILLLKAFNDTDQVTTKGYYLITTLDQILFGNYTVVEITPYRGIYDVTSLTKVKRTFTYGLLNYIVVGQVVLQVITE